jgi:hypothetical protein
MEHFYCIWVDLQNKLISLVETKGFQKFIYESRAAFEKVLQLLRADGYRLAAG